MINRIDFIPERNKCIENYARKAGSVRVFNSLAVLDANNPF